MSTIARISGQLHRRKLMLQCEQVPFRQRLAQQLTLHPSPRRYFRNLLTRYENRFQFHYEGTHLVSAPITQCNETEVAEGFALVIAEMYALPMLYWDRVRPSPGQVALDLGANVGTTSLALSQTVGPEGLVCAFEPLTHETITVNARTNNVRNVRVIPFAVGSSSGEAEMIVSSFAPASRVAYSVRDAFQDGQRTKVGVVALDEWCEAEKLERIDFIKMDVEGSEEEVIMGAERLIQRCHPMWSISSEHIDAAGDHQHKKLVTLLRSFGYHTKELGQTYIYAWQRP